MGVGVGVGVVSRGPSSVQVVLTTSYSLLLLLRRQEHRHAHLQADLAQARPVDCRADRAHARRMQRARRLQERRPAARATARCPGAATVQGCGPGLLCALWRRAPASQTPEGGNTGRYPRGVVARGAASCLCQGNHACTCRHNPRTKISATLEALALTLALTPTLALSPTLPLTRQSPTPSSRRTAAARCVSRRRMRTWPSSTPSSSLNTR